MSTIPIPCEVTLSSNALGVIPDAMFTHVVKGGKLYLVKQPEDGRAFICTHPDFIGKVCTFVNSGDVTPVARQQEAEPRDLSFIKPGATVWYVLPERTGRPIGIAQVKTVFPDDNTVTIVTTEDTYLGPVSTDCVFPEKWQAEAAFNRGLA